MHRTIEALVLNHGTYNRVPAQEMKMEQLRHTMKANFEGAVNV